MMLFAIAFLLGDIYVQTLPVLPSIKFIFIVLSISIAVGFFLKSKTLKFSFLAIVLGLAYTTWYASSLLSWNLPKNLEGQNLKIIGHVSSLPIINQWQTNFLFTMDKLSIGNIQQSNKVLIRLSWRHTNIPIKVGDKWQLLVHLKRVHGMASPGAFDFEAWALQRGIRATGYVVQSNNNKLLSHDKYTYPIEHFREILQQKIVTHLPTSNSAHWLLALIIGERNNIPPQDWQILRDTGTNHLMAIAGLHIGLLAYCVYSLLNWLWRRIPMLPLSLPATHAAAFASIGAALMYSAFAGFSLPTQRACMMLIIFMLGMLSKRQIHIWHAWSLALLCVLILNPLSILTESFWLSFATIALIIYGMGGRLLAKGFWWKWGRVQWVIGIGLVPVTLAFFQQCSLLSFVVNSIAIPWLGFLILPFCFLAVIFLFTIPTVGAWFLMIADKSLSLLWLLLTWFSQLHFATWQHFIPNYILLMTTMLAALIFLLPIGTPFRWVSLIWVLPLILYKPISLKPAELWMSILDVGQGLSVVIQTKTHTLVYDAGPKLSADFDMGENIVLPYLHTRDIKKIDMLVISHGDNDHIGGAQALLTSSIPILSLKTSVPEKLSAFKSTYCLSGYSWEWDRVKFSFLYPDADHLHLGNDSSCVLQIDNGQKKILLTGDIEKLAERNLLEQASNVLASTILIAPHHGSKTSGLKKFIMAVKPKIVLYSTGYRNCYHFPNSKIVSSYDAIHAEQFNTTETGTIEFKLPADSLTIKPELYRLTNKRYWMD